ncbi:MAG TPA: hypothetical protein PLD23_12775 [Armatimonadota bacterium]|nr:hypothetical protein [Armatimonadota bacterium]HQK94378.1 hypothetical protein [Armatimonadota bacterium]
MTAKLAKDTVSFAASPGWLEAALMSRFLLRLVLFGIIVGVPTYWLFLFSQSQQNTALAWQRMDLPFFPYDLCASAPEVGLAALIGGFFLGVIGVFLLFGVLRRPSRRVDTKQHIEAARRKIGELQAENEVLRRRLRQTAGDAPAATASRPSDDAGTSAPAGSP